ncbi:MAG: hypothetical protein KGQ51_02915 [Planctomycetes bacterium]|nr:hypothetical protein [Planctomycetota bacterium]
MLLHHTGWISSNRGDHWDWMLEPLDLAQEGLITFASTRAPQAGWDGEFLESLPRHRAAYLDYQGPVSEQRGHVKQVAKGHFRWIEMSSDTLSLELVSMDFLETPFTPWPTGRYCLTREPANVSSMWQLRLITAT